MALSSTCVSHGALNLGCPPGPPVTTSMPPQTVQATASVATAFKKLSLLENSQTTTVVNGTQTVVPVWYCGPTETAAACGGCPTQTVLPPAVPTPCENDFNALVLLPLLALPGAFLPPPAGLPTLTIDNDGLVKDYETPTPTPATSTSTNQQDDDDYTTPPLSCPLPTLQARQFANSSLPTITPTPVGTSPINSHTADMNLAPILPLTSKMELNPTNSHQILPTASATAALFCMASGAFYGGSHDPYYSDGFYQNGRTFSRQQGLDTIKKTCQKWADHNNPVITDLGPDFKHEQVPTLDAEENVGDYSIVLRARYDTENRWPGYNCGNSKMVFKDHYNDCLTYFGQAIDYCDKDPEKSDTDTTWKSGGSFWKDCAFFDVFRAPAGSPQAYLDEIPLDYFRRNFPQWRPTGFDWSATAASQAYQTSATNSELPTSGAPARPTIERDI